MTDRTQVIGSEGLAVNLAGLAQQVGALEKIQAKETEAVRREMQEAVESIRREIIMATSSLASQVTEKEQGIRRETAMATETIKEELAAAIAAARAAAAADTQSSRAEREMEIKRLEHMVTTEATRVAALADERLRCTTDKDAMWTESHKSVHEQINESTRVALESLNGRLNGFPQEYASKASTAEVKDQLSKLAEDIRLRMEAQANTQNQAVLALERRLVDGLQSVTETARREGRPGQDLKTSQAAVIAAIFLAIAVISIVVAIANFAK